MSLVDTKLLIDFLKKVRGFLQENEITCYDDLDNVFFRLFGKVCSALLVRACSLNTAEKKRR